MGVEGDGQGSKNLEDVFQQRLTKIGHVIALLDTWDAPRYLTRVWTIYEQFTAAELGVKVDMILPTDAHRTLMENINAGGAGIEAVALSLSKVDSENAEAFSPK